MRRPMTIGLLTYCPGRPAAPPAICDEPTGKANPTLANAEPGEPTRFSVVQGRMFEDQATDQPAAEIPTRSSTAHQGPSPERPPDARHPDAPLSPQGRILGGGKCAFPRLGRFPVRSPRQCNPRPPASIRRCSEPRRCPAPVPLSPGTSPPVPAAAAPDDSIPTVGGQSIALQAALYGTLTSNPDLATLRLGNPTTPSAESVEVARHFPTTLNPTLWCDLRPITLIPPTPLAAALRPGSTVFTVRSVLFLPFASPASGAGTSDHPPLQHRQGRVRAAEMDRDAGGASGLDSDLSLF